MARLMAFVPVLLAASLAGGADLVRYVQPLLGSMATERGYGGTMPSVTRPFGMTH